MITRLCAEDLIMQSAKELLEDHSIEKITVRQIAENCGITTRTFYRYFRDKYDVVSQIYLNAVTPWMDCDLDEWYQHMLQFLQSVGRNFMRNALCYTGQNDLLSTMQNISVQKLERHIKAEIRTSEFQYATVMCGIAFMVHGQFGLLRDNILDILYISLDAVESECSNIWALVGSWMPPVLQDALCISPVV